MSDCDHEPVAFIGAVQPFGCLILASPALMTVEHASGNAAAFLGSPADALIGKPLSALFGTAVLDQIQGGASLIDAGEQVLSITRSEKYLQIEIEKPSAQDTTTELDLRAAITRLQTARSVSQLCRAVSEEIQAFTGFDRVMIYRFHSDSHGEVVAESVRPGVQRYMGLHYPASDIPAPARGVFLRTWLRMIPRVNYDAVPVLPTTDSNGKPVDLGTSLLRAVSPIHLEYLRNMQVGASLTLSLIDEGKLWGLVACHHLTPRLIPVKTRAACETLGRLASALIGVKDQWEKIANREGLRNIHAQLMYRMQNESDLGHALTQFTPNLIDLVDSHGAAAAIYINSSWATLGRTPNQKQLASLISWIAQNYPNQPYFETHTLPTLMSGAEEFKDSACGVLSISLPQNENNFVLWFRPEIISTVHWAGAPDAKPRGSDGKLHPRTSFEQWEQTVRDQSYKWQPWEVEAALELRNAIMSVDLKRQYVRESQARKMAEDASLAREQLMAVVSHDLRNPISSIRLSAQLIKRRLPHPSDALGDLVDRILKSGEAMSHLINDILHVTKFEAGFLELEKTETRIEDLLAEAVEMLRPIASEQAVALDLVPSDLKCKVKYDQARILQVLSNLIGNAIKFSPPGTSVKVHLLECHRDFAKISITDSGPGIPKEHLTKVFDRFWQATHAKRLGTGLGLSIAKAIIAAHGGELWVESDEGKGSTFFITLPI